MSSGIFLIQNLKIIKISLIMKYKEGLNLSLEEWNELAEDPHEYLKIRLAIQRGVEVGLIDECGIIYASLKIDEIDNIKYVYKGFSD